MAEVVVSTWAEFNEAVGVSGNTVIVSPNTIWDMNDIEPEGVQSIVVSCANINGNGLVIKNARFLDIAFSIQSSCDISSISVLNALYESRLIMTASSSSTTVHFYDCIFSGIAISDKYLVVNGHRSGSLTFNRCGFNLKVNSDASFGYAWDGNNATPSFEDCHIMFDGTRFQTDTNLASYDGIRIKNTLIEGNLGTKCDLRTSSNSIINALCDSVVCRSGTISNVLVNADKCSSIANSYIPVTDAQLRDASYLSSIGFPIGED